MNVFDWIFIAALAAGLVLGLIKGFLKPLLSVIGIVVIAFGTSLLSPVVAGWTLNAEMSDSIRSLVSVLITVVLLTVIWGVVSFIIRKIFTRTSALGVVNRLIGATLGIAIVYLAFAVIIAWITGPMGDIAGIREKFGADVSASWIAQHLYAKNPFGMLVVDKMAEKLLEILQNSTGSPDAVTGIWLFLSIKK